MSKIRNTEGRQAGDIYECKHSISISSIQLPLEEEKFAVASVLQGGRPGNES